MIDGMTEEKEEWQRMLEAQSIYRGKREFHITRNLQDYVVRSITRVQKPVLEVTYTVKHWDDASRKYREFIWHVPNNRNLDRIPYVTLHQQLRDVNEYPDFIEKVITHGLSEGFRRALWRFLNDDLNCIPARFKGDDRYNDTWRAAELNRHPEYGPDGKTALDAIIASDALNDTSITHPQLDIVITPDTNKVVNVAGYLSGKRGILVDRIKKLGSQYELVSEAFLYCEWCFHAGYYDDDTYKRFDPPIIPENVKNYIPLYALCPRCGRENPRIVNSNTTTTWDLTLGDEATVQLTGVTIFDLAKGYVVATEFAEEYIANVKSLRCFRLQILQKHKGTLAITAHNVLAVTLTPALTDNASNDGIDINSKIRKLFFELCEQRSLTANPVVLLSEGLTRIYNDGDNDIKSSSIFKVGKDGQLDFNMASNYFLKQFRDSLTEDQAGYNGKLVRVGTTPTRFKFQPKPEIVNTNIESNNEP